MVERMVSDSRRALKVLLNSILRDDRITGSNPKDWAIHNAAFRLYCPKMD
jgi:hypothetical protein